MPEEHVSGSQDSQGGDQSNDASDRMAALEKQIQQLQEGMVKRDELIQRQQSDRDKLAHQLEREQQRRARLEDAQQQRIDRLPANEQTEHLRAMYAQQHQKATRFEVAHQYGLDPTELEGDFPTPEAMRMHAMELAQRRGAEGLEDKVNRLTQSVEQLTQLQAEAQQQLQQQAGGVRVDAGGRRAPALPAGNELTQFDELAAHYRKEGRYDLAAQTVLAKIHRDTSKVMGPAAPTDQIPPELAERMNRR